MATLQEQYIARFKAKTGRDPEPHEQIAIGKVASHGSSVPEGHCDPAAELIRRAPLSIMRLGVVVFHHQATGEAGGWTN
jgi:hypothetical protein